MTAGVWTLVIGSVYLAAMVYVTILAARKTKSFADFATAPRQYGPAVVGTMGMATTASAVTFLGLPGFGYGFGFPMLWWPITAWLGLALGYTVATKGIVTVQRNTGAISIPDYLGERFGDDLMRVIGAILTLSLFWWVLGNFVAMGWVLSTIFPITFQQGLYIGTVFTVAYVLIGGTHADVMTDVIQAVVMVIVAVAIGIMVIVPGVLFPGGIVEVHNKLSAIDPAFGAQAVFSKHPIAKDFLAIGGLFLAMFFISVTSAHGKYLLILRSPRDRAPFIMWYYVLGALTGLTMFGGMAARVVLGAGVAPDQSLPLLFLKSLPAWLAAFMIVAVIAGVMSTVDGVFLAMSVSVAGELYRKTYVPRFAPGTPDDVVDRRSTLIARLTLVALALLALYFAQSPPTYLIIMVWAGLGTLVAALGPTLLFSAYWRWVTRAGAYAAMAIGLAVYLIFLQTLGVANVYEAVGLGTIASTVALVVVSRRTQKLPDQFVQRIFEGSSERPADALAAGGSVS